jgi:hypothetical protein
MIQKLKSKLLTMLFVSWVNDEYDLELLAMTRSLIEKQETRIKWYIHFGNRVEIKGFRG